jgi:hypothetical protein
MKVGGGLNNEGLVFGYDANGFKFGGEPTTNLVPSAQHNGQFTTSNGWSTYNTNQYNGAQYFSIGTVGSVSNNIVTLSSVGRDIRSFDVLRAQTTGGGVTAGTDYVIKKLSSNTFSLHQYNGSQNGSQGYINPDTGFFKVHDAYANDVRLPINATDFPTMWWGAPHLPNSGLIKEIVPNEGVRFGTNAMRLHVYRNDGVADGMAYGVNTSVTTGDVITMSVWIKLVDDRNPSGTLGYSTYFGPGYSAGSTTFTNLTTDWKKYEYTWTASNTYGFISYWWPAGSSTPYAIDICDFQVEINKGHSTNFTTGTRTEAFNDHANTTSIDTSNILWTSDEYPDFNGSSTFIDLGSDIVFKNTGGWTVESIAKYRNVPGGYDNVISPGNFIGSDSIINNSWYWSVLNNKLALWNRSPGVWKYGSTTIQPETWYHAVLTCSDDGTSYQMYLNGEPEGGDHVSYVWNSAYSGLRVRYIGQGNSDNKRRVDGQIPVTRMYDRVLSANEVKQNYLSFKSRFGLS